MARAIGWRMTSARASPNCSRPDLRRCWYECFKFEGSNVCTFAWVQLGGTFMNAESQTTQTNVPTFQPSNVPTFATWPFNWALIRYQPWAHAAHWVFQTLFTIAPVA